MHSEIRLIGVIGEVKKLHEKILSQYFSEFS